MTQNTEYVCATCGKPIERDSNPFGQSEWKHSDGSGSGIGGHSHNWCETDDGYVKVAPAQIDSSGSEDA